MSLAGRPTRRAPTAIRAYTATCAAGTGNEALAQALALQHSGLRPLDDALWQLPTWVGRIDALDDPVRPPLPDRLSAPWQGRAIELAWLGLQADGFIDAVQAARQRWGGQRVGLVVGTSASTIGVSEQAYRTLDAEGRFPQALRHEPLNTPHALASFVQAALQIEGPSLTVSTACSSSAKALACAERWLRLGLADAVVVAGIDALCASVLYGFHALGLVANGPCRPFDAARQGISIGEAAAYALLERGEAPLQLLGHGESSDAHHMSSPHPEGLGAQAALQAALASTGLAADAVDLVNLHGTASALNDAVEAAVVARGYASSVHACATKGLTGHTMGAAGLLEAVICLLAVERSLRPGSAQTAQLDPGFDPRFSRQLALRPRQQPVRVATSHSFGFGGSNCVVVLGRGPTA